MQKPSIHLRQKHDLNPSIKTCFWCGESTNEIVLFGDHFKRDEEAPRQIIMNYEPCEKCQQDFAQGILVVEATEQPTNSGQARLDQGYPTGRHWIVKPEAIELIFTPEAAQTILAAGKCMIGQELAKHLGFYENLA